MPEQNQNPAGGPPPSASAGKNVGMAAVAYILFFIPLLTEARNDPYVKYHVKQGLVLFIGWVAASVIAMIPLVYFLAWLLNLGLLALLILGIINAVNGKEEPLPVIGQYAQQFKF